MQNIKKAQGTLSWIVVVSELGHVFCCVLPSLFSILSIMIGMGLIGGMPLWVMSWHDAMHDWEIPIITMAGSVVALGWLLHYISIRIDCHETGCGHGPCTPKKKSAGKLLKIATVLFLANVLIYFTVHIEMDKKFKLSSTPIEQQIDHGHSHDHAHHH